MRVPSHVDPLYHGLILAMAILVILPGFFVPGDEAWLVWIPGIVVIALLVWIIEGTWYRLDEDHLVCRSGPFTERIPYNRIKSIKACTNYASSMATSRHRLEIRQHNKSYVMGTTYISPKDQDAFLLDLKAKCRNLINN